MATGFIISGFWIVFIQASEATQLGISWALLGRNTIVPATSILTQVNSVVIALPLSALVMIIVSLFTPAQEKKHLDKVFQGIK